MSNPAKQIPPQQTIKLAIDCETGELMSAAQLLTLSEAEFSSLRRSAMAARVERKRGGNTVRFRCAVCKQPLYLSRHIRGDGNRWFVHDGTADGCPWHEGSHLSPDAVRRLVYRGQQEGSQHQALKRFLAEWLEKDPLATKVNREQTTFSEVAKGEWRRPDVQCVYEGKHVVFEIQLSYTFLSEVIARDEFYRREGIFIIWVFARFDQSRAVVTDEAFFNRRNLFVLDDEAKARTEENSVLTFSGLRQIPSHEEGRIADTWTNKPVTLNDVIFPVETYRPFFFDYDAAYATVQAELVQIGKTRTLELMTSGKQGYIDAALRYYESDYNKDAEAELFEIVDGLSSLIDQSNAIKALRDDGFYGWHAVLPVLLSIKLNKSIGFDSRLSVYQVIEAGLRNTHGGYSGHPFAVLYLSAYKQYHPKVSNKHHQWLTGYGEDVKISLKAGKDEYRRFGGYDDAVRLLFPELEKYLNSDFGLNPGASNYN